MELVRGSRRAASVATALALFSLGGCFYLGTSEGGGEVPPVARRAVDPADVAVPEGYRVEVVAAGLTFPVGITFDDEGVPYVVESGYAYDENWGTPRLLRLDPEKGPVLVATGEEAPWLGVDYDDGAFFVAEGGIVEGGKILRIEPDGRARALVDGLPGFGDHHTNGPVVGPDGYIYFGQGTATNSGVVGLDNYDFGWLIRRPNYHDVPCRDVTLTGVNYRTRNPLTPVDDDEVVTGAYSPFGVPTVPGQVIRGRVPCNGAIMRIPKDGGDVELVGWGFRNPWGLAFSPDGRLFITDNGYDVRGSRPVWGSADWLWEVVPGRWHGWPDFAGGRSVTDGRYDILGVPRPKPLLATLPNEPPTPAAFFGVHSSSNGVDFSRSERFGYVGQAFVAQLGDMAPNVGKVLEPVGYRVVRVDPATGVITPFAENRGHVGPASFGDGAGLERPVDVAFHPRGDALYVVDFGVMTISEEPRPQKGTGVVWRIAREGT